MSVYFIQARNGGPVKIGYSGNPKKRLYDLSVASFEPLRLVAVVPGDRRDEREVHEQLDHLRIRGEWFRPSEEMREVVRERQTGDVTYLCAGLVEEEAA